MVFRGPEGDLPLLQPVKISSNWTSRVYRDPGVISKKVFVCILASSLDEIGGREESDAATAEKAEH